MKIDFSQQLKNLEGVGLHEEGTPVTLGIVSCAALLATHPDDRHLSGEEKFARFDLASRIHGEGEVDISGEDHTRLRDLIGKMYGTQLVGPAYVALGNVIPEAPVSEPSAVKGKRRKLAAVDPN